MTSSINEILKAVAMTNPVKRGAEFISDSVQPGPLRTSKLRYKFQNAEVEVPTIPNNFEIFNEKMLISTINGAPRNIAGFNAIDMGGNQTFQDRLKGRNNKADTDLEAALKLTDDTKDAINDWEDSIKAIQILYKDKYPMSPLALTNYLTGIRADGVKALDAQFKHDKEALLKCFEDPTFKAALCTRTDINEAELPALQQRMLKSQEEAHNNTKANFEKETDALLSRLYQNNQIDEAKIRYLKVMHENNKTMRKEIDDLVAADKENDPTLKNISLSMNVDEGKIDFSTIDIKKLTVIQTLTGREIRRDENNTFSMQQPKSNFPYVLNKYYYHSKAFEVDTLSLVMAVRASGYKTITMNFTTNDEKDTSLALRGGRTQIRACLDAGFKPEDITINVNGTTYKYRPTEAENKSGVKSFEELYQNSPSSEQKRYNDKLKLSADIDLQNKPLPESAQAKVNEIKAAVQYIKNKQPEHENAPEPGPRPIR